MLWADVLRDVTTIAAVENGAVAIDGVQYDSRRVTTGDAFVAMRGGTVDGNRFVAGALARGAVAVLTDSPEIYGQLARESRPAALVEHGRRALSEASAAIFGHPERALAVSAVTGTNGKTTTAWLLDQMLGSVGRKTVLVGTIETRVAGQVRGSEHTTPESRDLLRTFADGVELGCSEAVIEASSHALKQERMWGMPVDVAMWTNLTQDHLDFHGSMDAYFEAKARLFSGIGTRPPRVAVVNAGDPWATERLLPRLLESEVMRYGIDVGNYRAEAIELNAGDTRFAWKTPVGEIEMRSSLTGRVNVENLLAASCAALARGMTLEQIAGAALWARQVPGRFQVVRGGESLGITVVVDYAHTDDALRNLIGLAHELVQRHTGRVITVFGCGGDRDRGKRPKMGRVAGERSDLVVVTSDNPRSEDPSAIIDEVMAGVRKTAAEVIVEEDRAGAIAIAIRAAARGDVVLIAGKGHEKVQIFADGAVPFDDVTVASGVLRELSR